jgi:hypothetical protein
MVKMILKPFKTHSNQLLRLFKTRPEYGRVFVLTQHFLSISFSGRLRTVFKKLETPDGWNVSPGFFKRF